MMKKFLEEFKAFALKGNMVDMAIGMIIATAFSSLVKSLTETIINPLVGLLFQVNLDGVGLRVLFGEKEVFFAFGTFISAIINFIILAFVLFCILKIVNRFRKKNESQPKAPSTNEILTEILDEIKASKSEDSKEI